MTLANVTISSGTSSIVPTSIANGTSNVTIASSGGAIAMATNGATAITVTTAQNVGIGTASPANKLHVSDTTTSTVKTRTQASTGYVDVGMGGNSGVFDTTGSDGIRLRTSGNDQVSIDTAGLLKFNSGYGSVATAYGCRAWATFNCVAFTVTASGNVSSITNYGTGDNAIAFTTAMPDANYSLVGASIKGGGSPSATNSALVTMGESPSTSGTGFGIILGNGSAANRNIGYVAVFR
jgi:hypothetical protein